MLLYMYNMLEHNDNSKAQIKRHSQVEDMSDRVAENVGENNGESSESVESKGKANLTQSNDEGVNRNAVHSYQKLNHFVIDYNE